MNRIQFLSGGGVLLDGNPVLTIPTGFIIEMTSTDHPGDLFGGDWEYFGQGRVLVGYDESASNTKYHTVLNKGGEETHTLTTSEMPSHSHSINYDSGFSVQQWNPNSAQYATGSGSVPTNLGSLSIGNTGGGQPHNNMQPYVVVYRWRRI